MRDHSTLRAFQLTDELALAVYCAIQASRRHEQFGLTAWVWRGRSLWHRTSLKAAPAAQTRTIRTSGT
jgi:hypothetical protein